jgi:hypothetical protein
MQDNEDSPGWKFMRLIEENIIFPRPHIQKYDIVEPISTMTSVFAWGVDPNFNKIAKGPRPILSEDFLVCSPSNPASTLMKVF